MGELVFQTKETAHLSPYSDELAEYYMWLRHSKVCCDTCRFKRECDKKTPMPNELSCEDWIPDQSYLSKLQEFKRKTPNAYWIVRDWILASFNEGMEIHILLKNQEQVFKFVKNVWKDQYGYTINVREYVKYIDSLNYNEFRGAKVICSTGRVREFTDLNKLCTFIKTACEVFVIKYR